MIERSLKNLLSYCRREKWAGYDPYDGLNSPLARVFNMAGAPARIAFTQLVKRCPVNLRPLLGIKKTVNPKGLALAIRAISNLAEIYDVKLPAGHDPYKKSEQDGEQDDITLIKSDFVYLIDELISRRIEGFDVACWGYNFDWQSRAFYAPRGTPNAVCTTYAANALLDWYERTGNEEAFELASGSCRFLLDSLNITKHGQGACFSYTPLDGSEVHNVNMLVAELLGRVYAINGEAELADRALEAATYTVSRQSDDGSWVYGESINQNWIDSFHTGYVLVSLKRIMQYIKTTLWNDNLLSGYEFYRKKFFLADFTPGYYHNKLFPIDVHSAAQAIITFTEMSGLSGEAHDMASGVAAWSLKNLQDEEGFFYYQRGRYYTVRIPFMRWAQTWMLYALSHHLAYAWVTRNG